MATGDSRIQRCYAQVESSFGVIPNNAGSATVSATDACLVMSLQMPFSQATRPRRDKTGSLSAMRGLPARKTASWSATMDMAASGVAGTAPDCDQFLQAAFGKAGVVTPGTKVLYALEDSHPSLTIYSYRAPSTLTQMVTFGAVVSNLRMSFGQEEATLEFSGPSKWVLDSQQMADLADGDAGKGGLVGTTFPAEPSSPVTAGDPVVGYLGQVTIDGQTYDTIRSASLTIEFARELPLRFGSHYAKPPAADIRAVRFELGIDDDDTSTFKGLKLKAIKNTPVDIIFQVGSAAGNIWKWTLNDTLLGSPEYDDSERKWGVRWANGQAFATTFTSLDEVKLEVM